MSGQRHRARTRRAAFTLIEVLISMLILEIALLAISGMVPTAYLNISTSDIDTRALAFAQKRLDQIRGLQYTDACLTAGGPYSSAPSGCTSIGFSAPASGYSQTYQVAADTPVSGVKQVTVTVTGPRSRQVQLITLVTQ
jgi:Tfp pilus assembly protein PilV